MVVAFWLVFILISRALQRIALTQIAELTNTRIEAYSVDFDLNGSVFIEKLVIRPLLVAGVGRPDREYKYDDAILKAETVYARVGIGSLLLLRPRLKEINVSDFVFNAQHDLDAGRWNVSALKIKAPRGGDGKMPVVRLERGVLQYSKVSRRQIEVAAEVALDARFEPAEETQDSYSFNITTSRRAGSGKSTLTGFWRPGNITIAGGISSAVIPVLKRSWTINTLAAELNYDQNNVFSLKLKVKDLLGTRIPAGDTSAFDSQSFLERPGPFTALQRLFSRYRPAGRVDIDLEASGSLQQPAESRLRGKVYCKDVSICDRKFSYTIGHLIGQIDFTENSAVLNNLCGKHGNVKVALNGWSKDFGPDWQYRIQVTSDNMALDDDLYNALSEKQKKFWSVFSPSGLAAIDYRLTRRSKTDKKRMLAVELSGAEAAYRHFPYPLKNLTGKLFFDRDSVIVSDVVSKVNGRKININGKVTGRRTGRPIYDISIIAKDVPLDSTLAAALSDRQRYLYDELNMDGLADAEVKIFTPKQNLGQASFIADVSLKETSLRVPVLQKKRKTWPLRTDDFPPAICDVSAKTVIMRDLIHIENLTGRYGQGLVSLAGRIWPGNEAEQFRYCLLLHAEQVQLNDDLIAVLPAPVGEIVSELQPKGKVNLIADLNKAGSSDCPDYRITVDCLGNTADFELFPYPLKDITGRLTITTGGIKLEDITITAVEDRQTANISTIKLNGQIALADDAFSDNRLCLAGGNISVVADNIRIKGKSLTDLKADIYYDPGRQNWLTEGLIAGCYGGRLTGKLELKQWGEGDLEYLLGAGFENINLKQFLADTTHNSELKIQNLKSNGHTSGKMSGSLSVSGQVSESLPRIGRCRLKITDMRVGKLSPLAKLLYVLNLTEPKDFAFDRMLVDSYIRHNRLLFEQFDLSGKAVAFTGSGQMDLQSKNVDLTLTARGRRLAAVEPSILQSLTEGLGGAVVRIEITGNAYGPQVETRTLPVIEDSLRILGTK